MKRFLSAVAARLLETRSTLLVLLVCAAWLAMLAGARSLMLPDEGRYIGVAWAMLRSGDWLTPTLDGLPYFHKPPLFYWLTGLALQLFGVNEWAGRLASVFGALLAVGGLFFFVRRYAGERPATLAAAVLVTQPMFFAGAQYANLDMLVAGMISATIVCAAHAILRLDSGRSYRPALAAAYVFAALGVLAKGLIGIVLPGAIVLAWLLLRGRYRLIPALLALPMIGLFVAVAAPWFVWMQISYHGFWDYFFVYHHFQRFAHTGFSNAQPFWFYLPVLFLGTLPWAPWIWRACAWKYLVDPEKVEIRSLMLVWMLGILVFFSLPNSKLVGYILPALPPLAFLIADGFLDWRQKRQAERAAKPELREQGRRRFALSRRQSVRRRRPVRRVHYSGGGLRFDLDAQPEQAGGSPVQPRRADGDDRRVRVRPAVLPAPGKRRLGGQRLAGYGGHCGPRQLAQGALRRRPVRQRENARSAASARRVRGAIVRLHGSFIVAVGENGAGAALLFPPRGGNRLCQCQTDRLAARRRTASAAQGLPADAARWLTARALRSNRRAGSAGAEAAPRAEPLAACRRAATTARRSSRRFSRLLPANGRRASGYGRRRE